MTGNADYFNNSIAEAIYVILRTDGDAAFYLGTYRRRDAYFFKISEQMLATITDHYKKSDQNVVARENYRSIKQTKAEIFRQFYKRFRKKAAFLDYNDERTMPDLKNKLGPELRNTLALQITLYKTLSELSKFFEQLDDQLRLNYKRNLQAVSWRNPSERIIIFVINIPRARLPIPQAAAIRGAPPFRGTTPYAASMQRGGVTTNPRIMTVMREGKCFNCGETGHIGRDCLKSKQATPYLTTRIQAIEEQYDESEYPSESENE